MARNIQGRFLLQGTLIAVTPLHVGGHGEDVDTDLPLARNGAGKWYVPGTSLAGVLRQWNEQCLRERAGSHEGAAGAADLVRRLWGYQEEQAGHASYVIVDDAEVVQSDQVLVEVRDGVGIDRCWGGAAETIKYDRAVLPAGTMLPLRVIVEYGDGSADRPPPPTRHEALAILGGLQQVMASEQLKLGAAGTRGLGRVKLEAGRLVEQTFASRRGVLDVLRSPDGGQSPSPEDIQAAQKACALVYPPWVRVIVRWRPRGPLMVKAGLDGVASDMVPLVSGQGRDAVALVLPGSSIKGALRYRAECILRTLLGIRASRDGDSKNRFLSDVRVPLVDEVFGQRGLSKEEQKADENQAACVNEKSNAADATAAGDGAAFVPKPGRGALSVADCYAKSTLKHQAWQAILWAEDDKTLCAEIDKAGLRWQQAYHVAVDRWTGGAAESFLYTVLEPHGVTWEPIRLELDLGRIPAECRHASIALLLFLLRDLVEGRLPLGFGTNRGLGAVEVERIDFEVPNGFDLAGLKSGSFEKEEFRQFCREISATLNGAWQRRLQHLRQRVRSRSS
jgi:CRISPR/Cas system CSM-associated protein Csm3 (group 7 of RAMP superfamily)